MTDLNYTYWEKDNLVGNFTGWYITFDGRKYIEDFVAYKLGLTYEHYRQILINCGAKEFHNNLHRITSYGFTDEEDIQKALVMLKLILS